MLVSFKILIQLLQELYYFTLQKKRFLVNLKTERNASKFAMFIEKENPHSFFVFHLKQLSFSPYECPGL